LTSSFQGKEQTKRVLDRALMYKLKGHIFREADGFFDKYFKGRPWTLQCQKIFESRKVKHVDRQWTDFPEPLS